MANVVSASAAPYQLNGVMLGGLTVNDNGSFYSLKGGTSGSYDNTLSSSINNQSIIAALNSVYDAAAGNEPGGASGSIQTNNNDGGFAGANFKYDLGHHAILEGAQELQFRDSALKISSSVDGHLDITADTKINMSGAVGMNGALTVAGAIEGGSTLEVGGAGSGFTDIDGSGDLTMGTITMTGFSVDADGDTALKTLAVDDDSTIGCDSDTDLLTLGDKALTVASDAALQFADAGEKISRSGDGYLDLLAGTKINMSGAVGMNGALTVDGAIEGGSTLEVGGAGSGFTDIDGSGDLTMGTITMTGFSVDADGDTALKTLAVDDDSTIGCDSDTDLLTLGDKALTVASDAALQFADAGEKISRSTDGFLDLLAGTKINMSGAVGMTSTLDVAGAIEAASTSQFLGDAVFGATGGEDSKLVIMGTDAAGDSQGYRLSVTGGILNVVESS